MRRVEQGESEERNEQDRQAEDTAAVRSGGSSARHSADERLEFRYVGQEDVAQLVAEGWTATPAIPGSRDFAFLMQRPAPQTDAPEEMPDGLRRTPAS